MKLINKHKIDTQFSMSSMTDIVFLLLIFFMLTVSSSSVSNQGLPVELPQSNNASTLASQVNVTITADLKYYVNQQNVKREQLEGHLKQKLNGEQPLLLLQIDKSVPVAHMIYVTDIAAALKAKVSVATQTD